LSVGVYLDEHVHRGVATGLRRRGIDVLTVQEDGHSGRPDDVILDRATEAGRLLFTQDDDFLAEACRRQRQGEAFALVVYGHRLRVTVGDCVRDLELIASASEPEELTGRVLFLPL
jgi:hypothetical protein